MSFLHFQGIGGDNIIPDPLLALDRKSTRLNSSHTVISYAVFCLKKKKMERGEVEGRGAFVCSTSKRTRPDWVREGKIVPLCQTRRRTDPDLRNFPLLHDLAQRA